jgi:hypothetical protein
MNKKTLLGFFIILMAVLSAGLFLLQNFLFHRSGDTGFYFFQDLAFLPINVLLVTLGVNAFISYREKQETYDKVNILIGEFFAESGFDVIRTLNTFVSNAEQVNTCAASNASCGVRDLRKFKRNMEKMQITADASRGNLEQLKSSLLAIKQNLLAMFENPNLLEHDRFTEMLWALYHLMDELRSRESLFGLPASDLKHLSGDIGRAYSLLVVEWAYIVKHMKQRYPYLYSLASRKNPFETNDIIVKE